MSKFHVCGEFVYYIAGIVREEAGNYSAYVPDVPPVIAGGDTVQEAIESASYGLRVVFLDMLKCGEVIKEPSSLEDVISAVKKIREEDGLPYPEGIMSGVFYQYIKAPVTASELVKFEIELPADLLSELDDAVRANNTSRSHFIKVALKDQLGDNFW